MNKKREDQMYAALLSDIFADVPAQSEQGENQLADLVDTVKHDDVAPGADKPVTGIQLVGGMVTYIFAQPVIMVPSEAEES